MSFQDLHLAGFYSAADDRLNRFYVPVLREAIVYDRMTGYFRSSSLVVAAAGLSRFIANGGTMRLIAGAELTEEDERALNGGEPLCDVLARRLLADPLAGIDVVSDHRLEVLAYLVKHERLKVRIGVPTDHLGRPLRRDQTNRYFHSKYGVLTDTCGNRVAFIGSDNESELGWRGNHESFSVAKSWLAEVWAEQGAEITAAFEAHWLGSPDLGWAVVDLPEAVRERLVARAKPNPPPAPDPAEVLDRPDGERDTVRLQFVEAGPRIGGGSGVGFVTAGVEPWPHQLAIARKAVATYPRGYLLADEVGLGKTIEVGLILRELLVSGKATTALLLVPASVLRQWQEELAEKFSLDVPRLERGLFLDVDDQPVAWSGGNPWRAFPVVLASSHLARRRDRREELLAAGPWDMVLVDEAHHARRSGSKSTDTPNQLLTLLQAMRASRSWRTLYLASATPMQMHAHEAWDLLELLGLTGQWSQSAAGFLRYYAELREPFDARQWEFLRRMSADYFVDPAATVDPVLENKVKTELGLAGSKPIRQFSMLGLSRASAQELQPAARIWMDEWLRRHTPTRDRIFRTTRDLLYHYKAAGILGPEATIPRRKVRDRFIPMTAAEERLYRRIETYISRYYNAYMSGPKAQQPLGFIMTIYRRRLTSSFLAIERSLRRRLDVLIGQASANELLDTDDLAAIESSALADLDLDRPAKAALAEEIGELQRFLAELAERPPDESKMSYLHQELDDAFRGPHDTAIVFTQYTDTMVYLRQQLLPVYGAKLVCYSGHGGERFDPATGEWVRLTKQQVKTLFREGKEVKILLGTDSLSEGLNLQTCGKLINYDMPWNFMRVEQRIGRIDRIGGKPLVEVSNYFYKGTVEEQIYQGIGEDFDWFTDVVGPAQPVLDQVERAIETVAMTAPSQARQQQVAAQVAEIRSDIEEAKAEAITLADLQSVPEPSDGVRPAITLDGLEQVLTTAAATAHRFHSHPTIPGAYLLEVGGKKVAVTLRRTVLDQYAPDVRLLTYGTQELIQLLREAGVEPHPLDQGCFMLNGQPIRHLDELDRALGQLGPGGGS
jgi:SNF2-related domain/Helicase conserved C-terminal domain